METAAHLRGRGRNQCGGHRRVRDRRHAGAGRLPSSGVGGNAPSLVGNGASDKLSLELDPSDPAFLIVDVGEDGTVDFRFDRSTFSAINVQAGAGDDEVRVGNGVGDVTVDGGAGNDTLIGGDGNDTLIGGAGDDVVTGGRGNDVVQLGSGNDTFVWNPGDGSDTVDGGSGHDAMDFNGSNANEHIDVSANGSRVQLTRDVGAVAMDLGGIEALNLTARGGADDVDVHDLAGTDMTQANVDLSGTPGSGTGDGAADTVTAFGTTGADHATVRARDGSVIVSGLGAQLRVTGAESTLDTVGVSTLDGDDTIETGVGIPGPAAVDIDGGGGSDTVTYSGTPQADTIALTPRAGAVATSDISGGGAAQVSTGVENLIVLGRGGDDSITAGNGLAGLTNLKINGGSGNDTITGGDGNDVLIGGPGDDVVSGGRGNDTAILGGGQDTFVWNPGDGSDAVDGGSGQDTLLFNGSNALENIALSANGSHVQLTRDVAAITMDLSNLEALDVTARGSADTITVNDLRGTGVKSANLDLSGVPGSGVGDGAADTVIVNGTASPGSRQCDESGCGLIGLGTHPDRSDQRQQGRPGRIEGQHPRGQGPGPGCARRRSADHAGRRPRSRSVDPRLSARRLPDLDSGGRLAHASPLASDHRGCGEPGASAARPCTSSLRYAAARCSQRSSRSGTAARRSPDYPCRPRPARRSGAGGGSAPPCPRSPHAADAAPSRRARGERARPAGQHQHGPQRPGPGAGHRAPGLYDPSEPARSPARAGGEPTRGSPDGPRALAVRPRRSPSPGAMLRSATAHAICARAMGTGAANCLASATPVALSKAAPARWPGAQGDRGSRAPAIPSRGRPALPVAADADLNGVRVRLLEAPLAQQQTRASMQRTSPSRHAPRVAVELAVPQNRVSFVERASLGQRTTSTRIAPAATADSSRPSSSASRASRSASAVSPVRRLSSASYQTVAATSERESSAIARSRRASIAALAPFTRSVMIKTTTQRW